MLWLNNPDHILCTYIFHLGVSAQYRFRFRLVVDHFLLPISNFCRVLSCGMTRACKHLQFCRHDIAKVSNMLETYCNDKNCIELRDKNRLCKRALKSPFLTICFREGRLDPILMRHRFRKVPVFPAITAYAEKKFHSGERFQRVVFSVTVFIEYVWTEGLSEKKKLSCVFKRKRKRVDGASEFPSTIINTTSWMWRPF